MQLIKIKNKYFIAYSPFLVGKLTSFEEFFFHISNWNFKGKAIFFLPFFYILDKI